MIHGEPGVIEDSPQPRICGVASLASRRKPGCLMIRVRGAVVVLLVAGITVRGKVLVVIVHMALVAKHLGVSAGQWPAR